MLAAEAVILILTRNWFDSKWCFVEFHQARALGKAIFPLIEAPTGEAFVSRAIQHLDLLKDREGARVRARGRPLRQRVSRTCCLIWLATSALRMAPTRRKF